MKSHSPGWNLPSWQQSTGLSSQESPASQEVCWLMWGVFVMIAKNGAIEEAVFLFVKLGPDVDCDNIV